MKTVLLGGGLIWVACLSLATIRPENRYANEWTFEYDPPGSMLAEAINSGTAVPLSQFAPGFGDAVFTQSRLLLCVGAGGAGPIWTDGARLDAEFGAMHSGVHYLRYDVEYDLRTANENGAILGVYFTGNSGQKIAGLFVGYDADNGEFTQSMPPSVTPITTDLPFKGALTAIVEMDLPGERIRVWYGTERSISSGYDSPVLEQELAGFSPENLRFHATGTFRPAGSDDYAAVENIRHTVGTIPGGAAWDEILEPLLDTSKPPELEIEVSDHLGGGMEVGQTNRVTISITNLGGQPASQTTSVLTVPSQMMVVASNTTAQTLGVRRSIENTYDVVASEGGVYTLTAQGISAETNSPVRELQIGVGRQVRYRSHVIEPVSVVANPGKIGPGETVDITVTSENVGGVSAFNITNTLSAAGGFTITPQDAAVYPLLQAGDTASTRYRVQVPLSIDPGIHLFTVSNIAGGEEWIDSFELEIYVRPAEADFVKADNELPLNEPASWIDGVVPGASDRAVMDASVTSKITTPLETNLSWRGIALVSNTVDWTISSGGTLSIGSAGMDLAHAGGDLTIEAPLHLTSTQSWAVATGRALNLTGAVSGGHVDSPVVKSGGGAVHLANRLNRFEGGIRVTEGTLSLSGNNVIGRGDLRMDRGVLTAVAAASLTNRVVLAGPVEIANPARLALTGVVSGPGALRKAGGGTLVLGGANTFSGGTFNEGVIEVGHRDALGVGPVTLNTGGVLQAQRALFSMTHPGIPNQIILNGNSFLSTSGQTNSDVLRIDGQVVGASQLTIRGGEIILRGDNSFSGGLVLEHANWLRVSRPHSLGTGPIRTTGAQRLLEISSGGMVGNDFELESALRLRLNNETVDLAGNLSGVGAINLVDWHGILVLSGDNREWSGNLINVRGNKTVRINGPFSLGRGSLISFGGVAGAPVLEINADLPEGVAHDMTFSETYNATTGESFPVEFKINHDAVFHGNLADGATDNVDGLLKTGPARLTINGMGTYAGPTRVVEGSLELRGTLSSELVVGSGATLLGSGTVHEVTLESGSTLRLTQDPLSFRNAPRIDSGATIQLHMSDRNRPAMLVGNGEDFLEVAGTLVFDFLDSNVQDGDILTVFKDWEWVEDRGVTVKKSNLSPGLGLNSDRLFIDGTISIEEREVVEPPILPGDVVKANNNDPLSLGSSWVGGVVPGPANRAVQNNRVSSPLQTMLRSDLSWKGIALISNTVDWTISGPESLTLGSSGVNMSQAGGDLKLKSGLVLPVSQEWEIAAGRTAQVAGRLDTGPSTEWTKTGEGALAFSGEAIRNIDGLLSVKEGALAVSGGFNRLDELRVEVTRSPLQGAGIRFLDGTVLRDAGGAAGLDNPIMLEGILQSDNANYILLAGPICGEGSLRHGGGGVLRLAGQNTFSGGTIVESGATLEFTHFSAFGRGPILLREGAVLRGWLPASDEWLFKGERTILNPINLEGHAVIENLADDNYQCITFAGPIKGDGGVRFIISRGRRDIYLSNKNTFLGDLEIMCLGASVFLNAAGPSSLGEGDIVCLSQNTGLGLDKEGGKIRNRVNLTVGSMIFLNHQDTTVEFSGEIFGSGTISFVNRPGTIRISGDNRNWSGGIAGIGSHYMREGVKRVVVEHSNALGTGVLVFGGHTQRRNYVEIHVRSPLETRNDLFAANSGPEKERNDLLVISQHAVFGKLDGEVAHQGLDKTGRGRMTLTAQGNYPSPFNVRGGMLELDSAGFPGKTTVFPGAGLVADNARTGSVRIRTGGIVEIKGGGMRVEGGALTIEGGALMTLQPSSAQAGAVPIPLLAGDETADLTLSGTLLVDFSEMTPAPVSGDPIALFGDWNRMLNNGVTILATGLDHFMTLDTSTLFTDGCVRVVDGGRLSSQELSIRVTSGGINSASVEVRNPENVIRYFRLAPGAEWPSWLSATPTSARTAVGPSAQATVSVTANAAGLPAGTHRFMLPVVWEHGVTDLILVTVRVEGPSLSVAPGALTLPVVEDTTGEGTVDLVNTGTLPVSYRIRRVLAEHEVYTQPAVDVPWITVSPTAQTEITSFTSGRSAPRAIGFGFPFFGATETEVSVGIDGTLWFGGKPAIRVFSNQLSYLSGTSKITAKPEADRFIVTWSRLVQSDTAQQTFQAILHRDGRIDLRYHTIVAGSAWQTAQIGLHGPVQWHPAQVPDVLQGRTIRFTRDPETARISIAQTSGTVAAGTVKTLTVRGDATGLLAGASRTATFAIEYDGGLTGTAGEVQVTMNVIAPAPDPVADGLMEEFAPAVYPYDPGIDPVLVLNPPQRTEAGRRITWRIDGEHGGIQPSGTTVYRIETTTNLAIGVWEPRAAVTNDVEYTDAKPMEGPVIFYRIIKERD